ncbi:MAG: peptidoglycan DD-metalloendopeptidase family protein [Miltoncostaeaceae bacterium]
MKKLQSALRRRGLRIAVDGAFGPATRRAVRIMQKRMKLRPTGVATAPLMRKLGLSTRVRVALSGTSPRTSRGTAYLQVFPVIGEYTYFDDFGAPRHQGSHEGTDIMADKGTPLVAVVDAKVDRVQRTERGLGGLYVWLERSDGTEYYYAHMAAVAPGLSEGQSVKAGDILGTVGNTGDARHGAAHLHFEIRPRGVGSINPYTHLVAVDGKRSGSAARR